MQHLSAQDILTILGFIAGVILGPMLALLGLMWHHMNSQSKEIREEMKAMETRIRGDMQEIRGEMKEIRSEMKAMETGMRGEMQEIRGEMQEIRGEMKEIRSEMKAMETGMRGEMQEIRGEMKEIRGEMKAMEIRLQVEINGIKVEIKATEIRLTNKINDAYRVLNNQAGKDRERISRIEGHLILFPTVHPTEVSEERQLRAQA